jgi:hypothetical protein
MSFNGPASLTPLLEIATGPPAVVAVTADDDDGDDDEEDEDVTAKADECVDIAEAVTVTLLAQSVFLPGFTPALSA